MVVTSTIFVYLMFLIYSLILDINIWQSYLSMLECEKHVHGLPKIIIVAYSVSRNVLR